MYILWRYKHGMQFYSKDMKEGMGRVASQNKREHGKKDMKMSKIMVMIVINMNHMHKIVNHELTYKN